MTHSELAKRIRDAIYSRSDLEGGAISREQMDNAIEGALARFSPANSWVERPAPGIRGSGYVMTDDLLAGAKTLTFNEMALMLAPNAWTVQEAIEWIASIPDVGEGAGKHISPTSDGLPILHLRR